MLSLLLDLFRTGRAADADHAHDLETTLVVVDMQPQFITSQKPETLNACEREIMAFVDNGWPIVILEYSGFGDTDERLMRHLTGRCSRFTVKTKSVDDGSRHVAEACDQCGYSTDRFRVVGVNIDACVRETVWGLHDRFPKAVIEVVKDACNGNYHDAWKTTNFPKHPNVVVTA